MDRKELETYQVQLSQVELALASDPGNEELTALRSELKELIELTEAALQAEIPASSTPTATGSTPRSASATPHPPRSKQPAGPTASLQAGDECLAKYSGDGQWYPARITSVGGSDERRVFNVVFKGYNSTELLDASALKPMPAGGWKGQHAAAAHGKRRLTQEEEDERDRKKKKNEKKLEVRAAKAKDQNNKQAAWQKFAKKSEKKGVVIAGMQGTSIFKTPDNPHGRVGVTGSGKAMTEYASREKHKFSADDVAS